MKPQERVTLLVTSGRGPVEVRQFVRLLAGWLGEELPAKVTFNGDPSAPVSALLETGADGAGWSGTHALVAPLRGNGSRKRWFVSVAVVPGKGEPEKAAGTAEGFEVFTMRSGGPGGQNVNKRATAVRVVDRASGLSVRASDQRSQGRNRALAVERLGGMLARREEEKAAAVLADRRAEHDRLERGAAGFEWRLDGKGRLVRGG